jgi:hypothetical protein
MPGYILDQSSTIMCYHGGQAQATAPNPRVKISGSAVVVQTAPHTVSGCPFVTPGGTPQPCVTAQWTTAAIRVKAGGMPVLLQDSQAICVPNGTGVNVVVTQFRVKAS